MKAARTGRGIVLAVLLCLFCAVPVAAAEPASPSLDLTALEEAAAVLDEATGNAFSFRDMAAAMIGGDFRIDPGAVCAAVVSSVLAEARNFSALFAQLLLLGVAAAVFHVFADSFPDGGGAKVGEYVVFLAFLLPAVKCFRVALDLGTEKIGQAADFLCAVFPYLFGSFALLGGGAAAAVVRPTVLAVTSLFLTLLDRFFLPLLLLAAALAVCSQLAPGYSFRKLFDLLKTVILTSLTLMLTVFTGLLGLEGFAAGTVDGLSAKTVKAAAGDFIPVVGGYLADAFDAIVGAGILLRSVIGLFGVVALAVFLAVPALKIGVMAFLFKAAAALLEPFGGKSYVAALSDLASVLLLVFAVVAAAGLLFFFLIFAVVGVSSMTMMFR